VCRCWCPGASRPDRSFQARSSVGPGALPVPMRFDGGWTRLRDLEVRCSRQYSGSFDH
jgi:hypothetical protein